jgi:hypothetical protein
MKTLVWLIILLTLLGCTVSESTAEKPSADLEPPALENLGKAPELTTDVWFNPEKSLRLADLRGKVVLLEMWTFG